MVNLAGTPTIGNPHSKKWARNLRESRVTTTRVLAEAIASSDRKPAFLAGNAIAWYGDHGDEVVTEQTESTGNSLLTQVTREWQGAAGPAVDAGARVCFLRTSPLMDRRPPRSSSCGCSSSSGCGARLGDGKQRMAMISLRDWVGGGRAPGRARRRRRSGQPVLPADADQRASSREALAEALDRKAFLAGPKFADQARRRPARPGGSRLDQPPPDRARGERLQLPGPRGARGAGFRAALTPAPRRPPATARRPG